MKYIVFGREVGESGTPHLQGTVVFENRKRASGVKKQVGDRAHIEPVRDLERSIEYCKKDEDFVEIGDPETVLAIAAKGQGARSDLEEFKESVKSGIRSHKELRELHSSVYQNSYRFCIDYVNDHTVSPEVTPYPLKIWQAEVWDALKRKPDDRTVMFVVDTTGNSGKTWFSRYYCQMFEDQGQIITPGKKADMAHAILEDRKVFFFDCPRSKQGEYIQYDLLEELKNGMVFSPKYESRMKMLQPPHVVVFMNEKPDMTKLSADRYVIKTVTRENNQVRFMPQEQEQDSTPSGEDASAS